MTDIDWTAVADSLFRDGIALQKAKPIPVEATVLLYLSYALRAGLDSAAAAEAAITATRAADEADEAERRWKDG